ncbi:MAG: PDZ domain-containing protein [Chloroflexi bacterium]|nr:PDZ domain-containing protein [Chloroflexota bacterium]
MRLLCLFLAAMLTACSIDSASIRQPTGVVSAQPTPAPDRTPLPGATPATTPAATATPTATATATPTLTATPTITPYPLIPTPTLAALMPDERTAIFDEIWTLVRDRYVYEDYGGIDWEAVRSEFEPLVVAAGTEAEFYALIEQMIGRLGDDHTRFDTPQDVAEEMARFDGALAYAGIGAMIRTLPDGVMITRLARGGPAEQAGLRPRDLIIAVNGIPISDTTAFGSGGPISMVRGQPGTPVRLSVRSGERPPRDVTVIRQVIPPDAFPSVEGQRLPGTGVGLVLIDTFALAELDGRVAATIAALNQSGPLDGLILDVRGNGGGRIDLLRRTLGLFIDGGSIGSSSGRNRSFSLDVPSGQTLPLLEGVPIVVLTGDETASAAEMFAAGLQVRGRARIVGMPSAGNTENLIGYDLDDGSRFWLAELVFRLPDGSLIEGRGVQPDLVVDAEWWRYDIENDPQVQAALGLLQDDG